MNVRAHRCMNRRFLISALLCSAVFVWAGAQTKTRYELVEERNFYIQGNNIAGLREDSQTSSQAVLGGEYTFGGNRTASEAPRTWNAGAEAASILHLRKFSVFGRFGFRHTAGYDMCAGMFIGPGRYPVDIMEFTPGKKTKQNYSFAGGVSVDLDEAWRVGARVDFSSANYAKLKDLRYTDYALDLLFRPGVQWRRGDYRAGLAAAVARNTETVKAEQVGESNTTYYAFIDKGMFYGANQAWTGGAIHLSEEGITGFPVRVVGGGVSAQFGFKGLYSELAWLRTGGRAGEKDALWFDFPEDKLDFTLAWQGFFREGVQQRFRLDADYALMNMSESVIEKVTEGGVTVRKTYAWNRILSKASWSVRPSWNIVKEGSYDAGVQLVYRGEASVGTMQYPYIAEQTLSRISIHAHGNWHCHRSVMLGARIWAGKGILSDGLRMAEGAVDSPTVLYRDTEQFDAWAAYNTKAYAGASAEIRYILKNNIYFCLSAGSEYRNRNHRTTAGISCGYNF